MSEAPRRRTALLAGLLAVLVGAALWAWRDGPPGVPAPSPDNTNSLLVPSAPIEVPLLDPVEYDGWTKKQWRAHRTGEVAKQPGLAGGGYEPFEPLFGQIADGLPWWGLDGQFCGGPGEGSARGPSDESRFLSNPFLLVAVIEGTAVTNVGPECFAVWPRPSGLRHAPEGGEVTYDLNRFAAEKQQAGVTLRRKLELNTINARDWGFRYVQTLDHANLLPEDGSSLLAGGPVELRAFIHPGGSCQQPQGCNNGSPEEPNLRFRVDRPPAHITVVLSPTNAGAADPDARTFTVHMK